ncbi:MAG: hypothetical protein RLZZ127_874 [Planctomycetota bacterium]
MERSDEAAEPAPITDTVFGDAPSDQDCLRRVVEGDPMAMDILVDRYQGDLLRTAGALLGDATAAQDVVQDAFLRLCRERDRLVADPRPLGGWLATVVRNASIDLIRARRPSQPVDDRAAPPPGAPVDGDALWRAVHGLPPLERAAVLLRYRDDLDYRAIAERLGKTVTHVGVILHGALERLRRDARLREVVHG